MKTGLTLGKFAPLHRGHQLLIEMGIEETDRFIVLIYDAPETTSVPLDVRAEWIRTVYPNIEVIEGWEGPAATGDTPEIMKLQEDYILGILGDRQITHFYSSEFYGDHVSKALGAQDRRIDPDRARFPVSGTAVRSDPFRHRQYLEPCVYRDLVTWAVFLGAPSSGKTTLCQALAERFETNWMPEYGREYWEAHQDERRLNEEQLLEIAIGHREREEEHVLSAKEVFFVDTDATTTRMFSRHYHESVHPDLEFLAEEAAHRYDLFFLCEDDIPYDDTWDRSGEIDRAEFQKRIRADLMRRGTPFISLTGSLEQRIETVTQVLKPFEKWRSNRKKVLGESPA